MTQKELILGYTRRKGVITPMIAFRQLNICALSQRIQELERDGYVFSKIWIEKGGKRYRGYSLVEDQRRAA